MNKSIWLARGDRDIPTGYDVEVEQTTGRHEICDLPERTQRVLRRAERSAMGARSLYDSGYYVEVAGQFIIII